LCADGTVTIPCQQVGTFPIHDLAKFERAISGTLSKVLSSNGAGNCALGAWEVKAAADGVDSRDLKAGGDQLPQAVLDFRHELRIAAAHRGVASTHFRKVVHREWQARNPARIDLKCYLLTQFECLCSADEEVLTRATRALVVRMGRGEEDDRKRYAALAACCST